MRCFRVQRPEQDQLDVCLSALHACSWRAPDVVLPWVGDRASTVSGSAGQHILGLIASRGEMRRRAASQEWRSGCSAHYSPPCGRQESPIS